MNLLERFNQEVQHREKMIRTFSKLASANQLISEVLMDKSEEWLNSTKNICGIIRLIKKFALLSDRLDLNIRFSVN